MKRSSVLVYTVLRLLFFLVPLAVMWLFFPIFREYWWLAALFAMIIGLSLSLIFLRKPLSDVSAGLSQRRTRRSVEDDDAAYEDDTVEGDTAEGDAR